jgi:hypothetical protein
VFREPAFQFLDLLFAQGEKVRVGLSFGNNAVPQLLCEPNTLTSRKLKGFGFEFLNAHGFASGSG